MKSYLKIIRWPNLLMIIVMQFLIRYALIQPILEHSGKSVLMNTFEFFILVFSCVFIAAGGYIINDIEDVEIDSINKPEKVWIGNSYSKDQAYNFYMIFTFIGVLGGFYLSFVKGYKYIGIINLVVSGFLYFYATSYKCIPVVGNVIVSILTALSVWIIILPEPTEYFGTFVLSVIAGYTVFAFLMTMIRELIKDLEDIKGDSDCGCKTLPGIAGIKFTKGFAIVLILLSAFFLSRFVMLSYQWKALFPYLTYLFITVLLPLLWLILLVFKAEDAKSYAKASLIAKMIMFTGIMSMLVFYFSFH